jgi:hypothetical protein
MVLFSFALFPRENDFSVCFLVTFANGFLHYIYYGFRKLFWGAVDQAVLSLCVS